jgi:uncharacterized protein (DUF58 family)
MSSSFTYQELSGEAVCPYLRELGGLRIAVFREFPYLYDGDLDYEEHYLETYVNSPRSLVVLLSDLLAPIGDLEKQIGYFAAGRHEIAVFQFLDPRELDFDFSKATHFRDKESQRDLFIDPAAAKAGYLERLNAHLEAIRKLCSRHGASYRLVPTNEPLEQVLFEFVNLRRG